MINLLHLPSSYDIAYECNIAYAHAKNYIADINIGTNISTNISTIINNIPNWCCFLFLFYFQIIYFVFLLYKSNYMPRLYHADNDADETYCCSITDEFSESDIDTEIVDNGGAMEVDDNNDNNDTYDKNYKNYMRNTYSNMLPTTLTTSEIKALNTKHFEYIISDSAKLVDAKLVMLYDSDTTSFWYYINQPSLVDFNTLESIALKYATKYNCMFAYNANVGVCNSLDKNIDKNIDKNNTTKSSVYASFKKNKRIEASDTNKSSFNHYRYMGKLLQYEELCAIQSLKSKEEPSVLTYNEYKDTLCNNKINTCIDSPTTCPMSQCKCVYCPVNEFPLSELCSSAPDIESIVLTTIPDHEKMD